MGLVPLYPPYPRRNDEPSLVGHGEPCTFTEHSQKSVRMKAEGKCKLRLCSLDTVQYT
jgi:hypothetical protein